MISSSSINSFFSDACEKADIMLLFDGADETVIFWNVQYIDSNGLIAIKDNDGVTKYIFKDKLKMYGIRECEK